MQVLDIDGVLGTEKRPLQELNQKVAELIGDIFHVKKCEGCMACSLA